MSDSKKLFSAQEAALAVLAKAKQILEDSSLMKAEKLKKDQPAPAPSPSTNSAASGIMSGFNSMGMGGGGAGSTSMPKSEMKKYETENKKAPSKAKELPAKDEERDFKEYEVKSAGSKDSTGPRLEEQTSPSGNPKEEAEGNNKPDGMEPEFEFKNKVSKELAKEKASHMVKSQSGMHTVIYQTAAIEKSEKETNDLNKAENPDKEADAQLGEKVEHDVEEHMQENAAAEQKEGHSMAKPGDKVEGSTEHASIPRLILSAKLSKFMEHMHSKRKNAQAQAPAAVGQPAANAPAPGSTQAGQPDMEKKYEGFKAVEASAAKSGASNPAAVAAAAGREKYGKEAFQHAAAAGKKMGKK